jgi:hypothetical protein
LHIVEPQQNPNIVEHEIKTYLDAKTVQKHLRVVNPRKAHAINAKVEKLLNVGFIYPILLTKWASKPVSVNKNK